MKRILLVSAVSLLLLHVTSAVVAAQEVLQVAPFGAVHVYPCEGTPERLILFLSGDGGWNTGVDTRSQAMATLHAVVVGVDINEYTKFLNASRESCLYPVKDFIALSEAVRKHLDLKPEIRPILLGYSSGAALVYAMLVQAPPHTFAGAISMGFCPDIPLDKPLCKGEGLEAKPYETKKEKGFVFQPSPLLKDPWLVFQGSDDEVCTVAEIQAYVKQVPNGEVVNLPEVGHGFRVTRRWLPKFEEAIHRFDPS